MNLFKNRRNLAKFLIAMTKSSPNISNQIHLNSEFRQMSNPIPIGSGQQQSMVANVNTASVLNWQPRLNQEDSTQFDPGIMDTSISPASYSLSPQHYQPQYHYQNQQPVYQFQHDIQFDLESLLVNTTLSDSTQSPFVNDEINPSFVFKSDLDLNNNGPFVAKPPPPRKLHHQLNQMSGHKQRNIMKIEEELDSEMQFLSAACSLPSNCDFQHLDAQRSDPVLTQLILNQNQTQPQQQEGSGSSGGGYQFGAGHHFGMEYAEHIYSSSLPANYLSFKRSNSPLLEAPANKRASATNLEQIVVKSELVEPLEEDRFGKLKLSSPILFDDNLNDFFLDQPSDLLGFKVEQDEESDDEEWDESDEESEEESEPAAVSVSSSSLPVNKTVKKLLNRKAKRQLQNKRAKRESDDEQSDFTDSDSNDSKKKALQSAPGSYVNSESLFDLMMSKNRDAYFWQYNIQSKGPKTKKVLTLRNKDPHLHRDFYDPVFQLQSLNAKSGSALNKLRKGDGNDVTPNAEKLYNLGNQIKDFIQKSYQMNAFAPVGNGASANLSASFGDGGERVNMKREKNKIASRACRLKKKAQHEANKIKLFGLNEEHIKFTVV
ncbi:CREBRF -like protein [Brachionus plicatilis]|uniref:CREBRF-like protein n=1 Tax=Brachionus plicatilis TaxID=10195 RepID=A0A3M7RW33_BRAPC|nr:CREBRF -like protein [Brachionus plicatilis]